MPKMNPKFWMVLDLAGDGGMPRCRHRSYAVARREAQRLADLYGREYAVLMSVSKAIPGAGWDGNGNPSFAVPPMADAVEAMRA